MMIFHSLKEVKKFYFPKMYQKELYDQIKKKPELLGKYWTKEIMAKVTGKVFDAIVCMEELLKKEKEKEKGKLITSTFLE